MVEFKLWGKKSTQTAGHIYKRTEFEKFEEDVNKLQIKESSLPPKGSHVLYQRILAGLQRLQMA